VIVRESGLASADVAESPRFTLDTSAVIAYFTEKPGGRQVERLLATAARGEARVFASFMTYMEVLYRFWRLHRDPEFRALRSTISLLELPAKAGRR